MTGRVLIVEDDHATRVLLEAVLERESIEAEHAGNGEDALRKIEKNDFAAVLLDLLMPHSSGLEFLKTVGRSRPELMNRIIVMTAAADSTWAGCRELQQVRCLLRKPLDIAEVVAHVRGCFAMAANDARATLK